MNENKNTTSQNANNKSTASGKGSLNNNPFFGGKERYKSRGLNPKKKNVQETNKQLKNPKNDNQKQGNSVTKERQSMNSYANRILQINSLRNSLKMGQNDSNYNEEDDSITTNKPSSHKKEMLKAELMKAFNKLPIHIRLIILAIAVGLIFFLILVVIIAYYYGEDIEMGGKSFTYTTANTKYWWPIGSDETTTENGVTFATGEPAYVNVNSNFGYRSAPTTSNGTGSTNHGGVDLRGLLGVTNVIASIDGEVVEIVNNCHGGTYHSCGARGNYVKVKDASGAEIIYQHLDSLTPRVGDTVRQGQVIGKVGDSGNSGGAHLHFEIRVNKIAVDPLNYISKDSTRPISENAQVTVNEVITDVEGNSDKQKICLILKANGYSENAAAAVMANIESESGFRPTIVNEIGATGICQWLGGRRTNLLSSYGNNWVKVENQMEFLFSELDLSFYSNVKQKLNSNSDAYEMTTFFCNNFERPGAQFCHREEKTTRALTYVKNGCK